MHLPDPGRVHHDAHQECKDDGGSGGRGGGEELELLCQERRLVGRRSEQTNRGGAAMVAEGDNFGYRKKRLQSMDDFFLFWSGTHTTALAGTTK
jgi:hypothetical protein